MLNSLVPVLLIGAVFYFLLIKPQIDEKNAHDKLVASLAKDDRVVTASGLWGRVIQVDADTVLLEIAEKTRVTIDKASVARRIEPASK